MDECAREELVDVPMSRLGERVDEHEAVIGGVRLARLGLGLGLGQEEVCVGVCRWKGGSVRGSGQRQGPRQQQLRVSRTPYPVRSSHLAVRSSQLWQYELTGKNVNVKHERER